MADFKYQELDAATQQQMLNSRLRDLEQQHLTLALRVNAPDPNSAGATETDNANIAKLESSIQWIKDQLAALQPQAAKPA